MHWVGYRPEKAEWVEADAYQVTVKGEDGVEILENGVWDIDFQQAFDYHNDHGIAMPIKMQKKAKEKGLI